MVAVAVAKAAKGGGGGKGGRGGASADRSCALYADDLPPGRSLLGGAANFCDAFFHVRDTREAGLPLCCLRHPRECEGRHTVIIARLTDAAGATKLVARFKNRDKKTHAERVLIQDERLRAAVCDGGGCAGGTLSAFISLQPCHHSSGNESVSCTTDLIAYHARELAPRGVSLDLAIAYPYRSHWQPDLMSRDELIELGARSLWGHKFHSSVLADQAAVGKAVEALGDGAADEAVAKARALLANAREGARYWCARPTASWRAASATPTGGGSSASATTTSARTPSRSSARSGGARAPPATRGRRRCSTGFATCVCRAMRAKRAVHRPPFTSSHRTSRAHTHQLPSFSGVSPAAEQPFAARMQRTALIRATPCAALVDSRWLVTLKIGRVSDADSLGPPLAMFSPGGGRATLPAWFAADWAASDELRVPLETEFFADALPMVKEEPLRRTAVRSLFTRTTSPDLLDVKTTGAEWGMLSISRSRRCSCGASTCRRARALLPEGTRLLCSTQAWIGDEVRRLQPLLDELRAELAAMPEGAATQQARARSRRASPRSSAGCLRRARRPSRCRARRAPAAR